MEPVERDRRANRYLPETRERAVWMVLANGGGHADRAAAIRAIAPKIGCSRESLRRWVIQAEVDGGARDGVTRQERDRVRALEREVRELRQANGILRKASAYFAQAELDRPSKR
jgi:transposase-like protein